MAYIVMADVVMAYIYRSEESPLMPADTLRNRCVDTCVDTLADMRMDVCVDMCADMRMDMCVDMHRSGMALRSSYSRTGLHTCVQTCPIYTRLYARRTACLSTQP